MNHSLSLSTKCLLSYFYCWLSYKGIKCPKKALRQTQKLSCSSLAETLIYSSSAMLHLHSIYVQYRYKTLVASPGCSFFTIYSVSCVFFNSPLSALYYFIKICWTFDSDFDAVLQHVKLLVQAPLLLVYSSLFVTRSTIIIISKPLTCLKNKFICQVEDGIGSNKAFLLFPMLLQG